jgi:hypothetical protein
MTQTYQAQLTPTRTTRPTHLPWAVISLHPRPRVVARFRNLTVAAQVAATLNHLSRRLLT